MRIADEAEARYDRKVAWGVDIGGGDGEPERILFTHIAVPVMTRLRQPERQVLDTLVDAGVARSRSDALAWSVRLVGEHADEWLGKLRDAMRNVDDLRAEGPAGLTPRRNGIPAGPFSQDVLLECRFGGWGQARFDADVGRAQRRGLRQRVDRAGVDEQVAVRAVRHRFGAAARDRKSLSPSRGRR